MTIRLVLTILLATLGTSLHGPSSLFAEELGLITGQLADSRGQIDYVGEVVVFLCDAKSGYPIDRKTKKPMDISFASLPIANAWHTVTSKVGLFEFKDVPVGQYRLIAQSWSGTKGLPDFMGETSTVIILHGTAENVTVKAGEKTVVFPRQLGRGRLKIVNDPEEGSAFLLLSLKPTIGDAILGPACWGDEFISHIVGVTHMHLPHVTILGVPENASIHAALMNYDNNPGIGAASYKAGQSEGKLRIVATWSNGHKLPPAELKELTDFVSKQNWEIAHFLPEAAGLKTRNESTQVLFKALRENPKREVEIPGMGQRLLADVAAAYLYTQLKSAK